MTLTTSCAVPALSPVPKRLPVTVTLPVAYLERWRIYGEKTGDWEPYFRAKKATMTLDNDARDR